LFNSIVHACNTYTALLPDTQQVPVQQIEFVKQQLTLRRRLLTLFVIFYSAGKLRRRFRSAWFEWFRMKMSQMLQEDVEAAVQISPYSSGIHFTGFEIALFTSLFADPIIPAWTYPRMSALFSDPDKACYSKQTAWELHRLLLTVLETVRAAMETLYTTIQSPKTTLMEISAASSDVRLWMARLQAMVHESPATAAHMKALEPILSPAMDGKIDVLNTPTGTPTSDKFTEDLDDDGGATDTTIEISLASKESRVGEECLWLITRYQTALECLTAQKTLPKQSVSFTLLDVSAADVGVTKTDLHSWRDVVTTLYPPLPDDIQPGDLYISSEEAIATLEDYGQQTRTRATHILRSPTHTFSGCWHAEAILGTLRHLSQVPAPTPYMPRDIDLTQFQNTFRTIGVSKRCCPVCTKVLSLLGTRYSRPGSEPNFLTATHPMVFSCHQNIYPTALPPYLPQDIAVALLQWLQSLVKPLVNKLVLKRRRLSKDSQRSTRSSDSKGHSPGKHVEESGSDVYHRYSELGLQRRAG